jgi:hypothetical protein
VRTALSPKHNDWYEELCALACIGELSSSEFEELKTHLAECAHCRELHADFHRISADDLGWVAVSQNHEKEAVEVGEGLDEHALLNALLDRARQQRSGNISPPELAVAPTKAFSLRSRLRIVFDLLRRPALSYGAVALLLCAVVGVSSYRLREAQLSPSLSKLHREIDDWKNQARTHASEQERTSQLLARSETERDRLRKSVDEAEIKFRQLQNEQKSLDSELARQRDQLNRQGDELVGAKAKENEKSKQMIALEARLHAATDQTEEQRRFAESLQARLDRGQEQAVATPEAQGFGDIEAKQLFGARDLHIVDVYDVDAKGMTKRTYGRVYYVEKKLLMLYAFDLESKKHNRAPASFQAWGYRQPNQSKPESLGLFSMDDPSVNRWVLKVNNPRVLERIDAVFVTAETPSGSPSPTGRRILYANLAGPANHP